MTEIHTRSTYLAARRTALAAGRQRSALAAERISEDQGRPARPDSELEQLGRDLAKACLARAERHSIVDSIAAQAQLRRDWYSALGRELEERRLIACQLMAEGLRLIAPDERRKFVDLTMQWLDDVERSRAMVIADMLEGRVAS